MSRLPGPVYVPFATSTISPSIAASIAAWIVEKSAGTWISAAGANVANAGSQQQTRIEALTRQEYQIRFNILHISLSKTP
jgi:hypothetical protein